MPSAQQHAASPALTRRVVSAGMKSLHLYAVSASQSHSRRGAARVRERHLPCIRVQRVLSFL